MQWAGREAEALDYYLGSLSLAGADVVGRARTAANAANLLQNSGQRQEAQQFFEQATADFAAVGLNVDATRIRERLAELELQMDSRSATELGLDLMNARLRGDIGELTVKYLNGSVLVGPGVTTELGGGYPIVYVYFNEDTPIQLDFTSIAAVEARFGDGTLRRYGPR